MMMQSVYCRSLQRNKDGEIDQMASEIKPIYGTQRVQLAHVLPLDTPYSAFVFPTTFCNFKCAYCGHSLGLATMKKKYDFSPEHMTMDTYEKTIEQLAEFPQKLKMLSLTGQGEPLLNPHIADMVQLAKEKGVAERVEIISNASKLTPSMADALIDAGLDTLRISLQGLSSKKYEEICQAKVDFDVFVDNVRYFYAHKKTTNLFLKVMDVALDEGEDEKFYQLFGDCTDRMYIEHMLPAYDGVEMTKDMKIESDRYGVKTDRIYQVCPLAFYMLGVFPNGDVEPCDTIYKPIVLGNVHEGRILDMWNSSQMHEFWRMQLEGRRSENKRCANCCAPNDVAHPEDHLDDYAEEILARLAGGTR